ncbi:MAG TPA: nucleoside recognition protein, partial [Bacillota bacterium]|nr:nucleoside recognition protein [Bacillota bacterium]
AFLIPTMILFEYARHYRLIEKLSRYFNWLTRWLTLSPAAAFPLVIGLFFGVVYGAAVLIEFSRQQLISKRDMVLLGTFLALNHSIIEDNLLFAALGANFPMLLISRLALAVVVTRAMAYWLDSKKPVDSSAATAGKS